MSEWNLDKPCMCPYCDDTAMEVSLPIWVQPGEESLRLDAIDWESSRQYHPNNWYCPGCCGNHLPKPQRGEDG